MSRKIKVALAAAGVALGLASVAVAQQPPAGEPPPGQPPRVIVQPQGQPGQMPPGMQPGQMPPGMRQPPPGGRPMPGQMPRPRPMPRPEPEPAHEESHAAHHCPGHGPLDSPHAPNWWQGILMVNNEAAKFGPPDEHGHFHREDGFVTQLFYRYENEKDECDPKNQPAPFLASLLNFGVLAFVLYRFGKKPLADALLARKKQMMAEIDTATTLKDEAESRLADYEDKLDNLDDTLEQMKKDFAAQSETERQKVLSEAEDRRVRMKRDVELRIEQELKAAKQQLLLESVEAAVAAAEELLKKQIKPADLDKSADEFLVGVGAAWKSGGVS
ncbi:MAG: ATP synthase F0 subunit B [Polyangiaceae bacterium]